MKTKTVNAAGNYRYPVPNNAISLGQRIIWWKKTRGRGHFNMELYKRVCEIKYNVE